MLRITLIIFYIFFIFLISIIYKKFNQENKEVLRKILHIGIGPLVPLAKYLLISKNTALIFTSIIFLMILLNYTYRLFPTIEDVDRKSFGTLFYCLSLFILILFFWDKDPNSLIAGFFVMTFGDGLAGLVGKNINSKSWFVLGQKKSLIGTTTMLFISFIVVFSIGFLNHYSFNINYFTIAFVATALEQLSILGIDNFLVPIASGICFNYFVSGF